MCASIFANFVITLLISASANAMQARASTDGESGGAERACDRAIPEHTRLSQARVISALKTLLALSTLRTRDVLVMLLNDTCQGGQATTIGGEDFAQQQGFHQL
jgi:hypothetical protein